MAAAQVITMFGPDESPYSLPADVQACVMGDQSTGACDATMGSSQSGLGWCARGGNASQTYCACVNAPTPAAACFFAPCTNNAFAYIPTKQRDMIRNANGQSCPSGTVICNQIFQVGGSNNVVSNISQQCGIITNVTNVIKASPYLAVLLFVLILLLVMVISMKPDDAGSRPPPLPPSLALSLMA